MTNIIIKDENIFYFYTINQDKYKPNYYENSIQIN